MTKINNVKSLVFSMALLLMGLGAASPSMADEDSEKLKEINTQWVQAFAQEDFQAIQALMTSDSLLMSPNEPAVKGPEAIVEVWKSWAELANVAVEWGSNRTEVSSSADMAYEYGWYTFGFDTENGRIEDKGKYIVVWKNVDGAWKVAVDIFNTDLPLPEE